MNHHGLPPEKWHYPSVTKRDQDGDVAGTVQRRGGNGKCLARGTEEQEDWSMGQWGKPESKQIQHHKSRCKRHSFTGWHLGYCSQRLLSTPSLRKGHPAPLKARSSSYLTPKDEKSLTEVPLEAQKETQGPIDSAECRFPTAQVNGLPVPNMQQAGIWQSQRGKCQRRAFPTAPWQVQLPSKQHRVSTKTTLCFWNHTQSIMWNLSLNSKTN